MRLANSSLGERLDDRQLDHFEWDKRKYGKKCYENSLTRDWQQCDHKNILDTNHSTLAACLEPAVHIRTSKEWVSAKFIASVHLTTGKWREKVIRASIGNCTLVKKTLTEFENTCKRKKEKVKKTPNTMEPNLCSNKTPSARPKIDASWKQQLSSLKKRYSTTPKRTFLPPRDRFYKPRRTEWGKALFTPGISWSPCKCQ